MEFFFGSNDRLGTDLVFLGTVEIWGQIRDIIESEEIDGLYGEKIKIESPHLNEYYKVVVVK